MRATPSSSSSPDASSPSAGARHHRRSTALALLAAAVATLATARPAAADVAKLLAAAQPPAQIQAKLDRYKAMELRLKNGALPAELQPMLPHLRRAADAIDRIYWQQMSPDGLATQRLLAAAKEPEAQNLAKLMAIHYGPWDRHADDEPFLGRGHRPPGANLYPLDTSARELDEFIARQRLAGAAFFSAYARVVREGTGFSAIPYATAYKDELGVAATALMAAADAYKCSARRPGDCKCSGFVSYLRARAIALHNDKFSHSDMMWMDTGDCPLDIAIGPHEFYDDRLLGLKATYEAIVFARDASDSAELAKLTALVPTLAAELPVPAYVRARFDAVRPSPVTIADLLYTSGDARAGNQIRAFTLPNDDDVRRVKGSKNVVLRNVVRAKFDALARPVAQRIFEPDLADQVAFPIYLQFLITWQLSHGLVPQPIERSDGSTTTARQLLRARYPVIESLQGEVVALLNLLSLIDRGAFAKASDQAVAATYVASIFDAMRQSQGSPQTVARTILYNQLAAAGAVRYDATTRRFAIVAEAVRPALAALAAEVLQVLARGDYEGAGRLIVSQGLMPGELRTTLASLADVPVDILPVYAAMP